MYIKKNFTVFQIYNIDKAVVNPMLNDTRKDFETQADPARGDVQN